MSKKIVASYNGMILRVSGKPAEYTLPTYVDATGGTITYSGNYRIHTFNSSDNFIVTTPGDVSCLIVGGGGGSGAAASSESGGAGGGGGQVKTSTITVTATTYGVVVGIGGAINGGSEGKTGYTSSIGALISSVGGNCAYSSGNGGNSGSGFTGGVGWHVAGDNQAGGGGAGDSQNGGTQISTYVGSNGGDGSQSDLTGSYYGGGGANLQASGTPGNGQSNAGGGGNGGYNTSGNAGNKGIVIIKYRYQ